MAASREGVGMAAVARAVCVEATSHGPAGPGDDAGGPPVDADLLERAEAYYDLRAGEEEQGNLVPLAPSPPCPIIPLNTPPLAPSLQLL